MFINKKGFVFLFVALFSSVVGVFAEKVYKEIVIDGEKVNKWMELDSITEYDQRLHGRGAYIQRQ